MRVIAVLNQKGGVGKTSTAVNLGAALSREGHSVMLLDMDPQAHLTYSLGIMAHSLPRAMSAVLMDGAGLEEVACDAAGMKVVPASVSLAGAEVDLAGAKHRETRLQTGVKKLSGYDFVIMDCPPNLGLLTLNAMTAARELLVPVQPEFLALQSLGKLTETVAVMRSGWNPDLTITGILMTRYQKTRKLNREIRKNILEYFGDTLLETVIRNNVSLAEAPSFGQDIFTYKPGSNGAQDYRNLALELLRRGAP